MKKLAILTEVKEVMEVEAFRAKTNGEVSDKFLSWNADPYSTVNQWTFKDMLFSYNTVIALISGHDLYVTSRKYSTTTSKFQNQMVRKAEGFNVITIDQRDLEAMAYRRFNHEQFITV